MDCNFWMIWHYWMNDLKSETHMPAQRTIKDWYAPSETDMAHQRPIRNTFLTQGWYPMRHVSLPWGMSVFNEACLSQMCLQSGMSVLDQAFWSPMGHWKVSKRSPIKKMFLWNHFLTDPTTNFSEMKQIIGWKWLKYECFEIIEWMIWNLRPICLIRDPYAWSETDMRHQRLTCFIGDQHVSARPFIGDRHASSETHKKYKTYPGSISDQACWSLMRHVGHFSKENMHVQIY